jgi:hypothetical protein
VIYRGLLEKETQIPAILPAGVANSLNKQVYILRLIPLGKLNYRNFDLQAVGLTAPHTFKVNMVVMMVCGGTGFVAKGIFHSPLAIEDFMDKALVEESF